MAANAKRMVESDSALDAIARKTVDAYEQILDTGARLNINSIVDAT